MTIPHGPKVLDLGAWIAVPVAVRMPVGPGEASIARLAAQGES